MSLLENTLKLSRGFLRWWNDTSFSLYGLLSFEMNSYRHIDELNSDSDFVRDIPE